MLIVKLAPILLAAALLAACGTGVPAADGHDPGAAAHAAGPSAAASTRAALPAVPAAKPSMAVSATELPAFHWRLARATDASGRPIADLLAAGERPLQLDFHAGAISISNGCNRSRGSWSVDGDQLKLGPRAATLMACPDGKLAALDAAAAKYLKGTLTFRMTATAGHPTLRLADSAGASFEFTGIPTPETRYGNAGETVFLEVAPQPVACEDGDHHTADSCLSVRMVHYAANGVRSGAPGPWQTLREPIEGYTHEPGTAAVLRVKRYADRDTPADASSVAYVLDLVVESRREAPQAH